MHGYANRWHLIDIRHGTARLAQQFFAFAHWKDKVKNRGKGKESVKDIASGIVKRRRHRWWHRCRQRERRFNRIIGKESRREVGYGKREIKRVFENGLWRNRLPSLLLLSFSRSVFLFRSLPVYFYSLSLSVFPVNLFHREIRRCARWNLWTRMPSRLSFSL